MAKTGPKPIPLTPELIKQAETLAALGKTNLTIAQTLGLSRDFTFGKNKIADAIKRGREECLKKVEQTIFEIALEDRDKILLMFIAKCKCGWREKNELDVNHNYKPIVIRKLDGGSVELAMQQPLLKGDTDGKENEEEDGEENA